MCGTCKFWFQTGFKISRFRPENCYLRIKLVLQCAELPISRFESNYFRSEASYFLSETNYTVDCIGAACCPIPEAHQAKAQLAHETHQAHEAQAHKDQQGRRGPSGVFGNMYFYCFSLNNKNQTVVVPDFRQLVVCP